jgi:hypothetical protein
MRFVSVITFNTPRNASECVQTFLFSVHEEPKQNLIPVFKLAAGNKPVGYGHL